MELAIQHDIMTADHIFDGRFEYPAHKAPTQVNIDAMRKAEKNLDTFWEKLLEHMTKTGGMFPELQSTLTSRPLNRTPAWQPPVIQREKITVDLPVPGLTSDFKFLTTTDAESEVSALPARKNKVKTRPIASPVDCSSSSEEDALPDRPSNSKLYSVDKRALKVFETLFFIPKPSAQPGEISWNDFLYTMTFIGFGAVKVYGSVWMFEPSSSMRELGAIQFHEPHPGKLQYTTARAFGRRLTKRYGWTGASFALK